MKFLAFILILVVVALVIAGAVLASRAWRRWQDDHTGWEMAEQSDGEAVKVLAVKPGEEPLMIGYVPFGSPEFDSRIYELRSEGRAKVYALNQEGA